MKSTKIEDILETDVEDITDDVGDAAAPHDDTVNNELKMQLDDLQNELSNMKKSEYVAQRSVPVPTTTATTTATVASESAPTMSTMDKLITFKNDDFKSAIIMMLLFILLNSTQVNEMIDLYMPYSIYTYGYLVKSILYFVLYRIIVTLIIA